LNNDGPSRNFAAIALGEVVDDAIIDVENILRRLQQNVGSRAAAPGGGEADGVVFEVRSAVVYARRGARVRAGVLP
jgi:Cu/Ag efflux pump CusA